jgi:hypothetical protein
MGYKHTPGPWYVCEYAGFFELQTQPFYGASILLNSDDVGDIAETNARLASAAPDMLEFITRWLNEQCIEGVNGKYPEGSFGWKAQQIIKKATE